MILTIFRRQLLTQNRVVWSLKGLMNFNGNVWASAVIVGIYWTSLWFHSEYNCTRNCSVTCEMYIVWFCLLITAELLMFYCDECNDLQTDWQQRGRTDLHSDIQTIICLTWSSGVQFKKQSDWSTQNHNDSIKYKLAQGIFATV